MSNRVAIAVDTAVLAVGGVSFFLSLVLLVVFAAESAARM